MLLIPNFQKKIDERVKVTLKVRDLAVLPDLRIKNDREASYEDYWQNVGGKIEELPATALDDQRYGLSLCSRVLRNLESTIFIT